MKHVVITGVSTGIGYGAAKAFTQKGYHVFGSVRQQADAERLSAEFGPNFTPLIFDVRDEAAITQAVQTVSETVGKKGLAGLINNAGMALSGPLMHQPIEEVRLHFEVNILGLLAVTQAFLPMLGASKTAVHPPGRIINISSAGGIIPLALTGAYTATKHALEGLSHTLRRELQLYGIEVIIIGPGVVQSEIWEKQKAIGFTQYEETDYASAMKQFGQMFEEMSQGAHTAEEFGQLVLKAFETKRPKVRYAFVANYVRDWVILRNMPQRLMDRFLGRMLKIDRLAG